jgi:hypothetical protein
MRTQHNIAEAICMGAIAGVAATWVMTRVTTWLYAHESEQTKQRENEARGDRTAYETAAERMAAAAGAQLDTPTRRTLGNAIHWSTGIGLAILYTGLRRRMPAVTAAKGLLYGSGVFLVMDEFLNAALGLTPGPRAFPWQAHARGLGGHLAYGLATELMLEQLDRVA